MTPVIGIQGGHVVLRLGERVIASAQPCDAGAIVRLARLAVETERECCAGSIEQVALASVTGTTETSLMVGAALKMAAAVVRERGP